MLNVAWICLDKAGNVDTVSLVEFTDQDQLAAWRRDGRDPLLVDFGEEPITIPAPLPATARVLK